MNDDALVAPEIREMAGAAALPRVNGDLVFGAPWQGRCFGTAVAAVQHLGADWDEFRRRLIAAIDDDPERPYYESWVVALERFAVERGLVSTTEIDLCAAHLG